MPPHNGPDLVLYYHPFSLYSQKVAMCLYQKKMKFRPMFVDINQGRQFNERFLALNPKGEVPVLVDDVRVIPDSEHIINYLEDNFSNGTPRMRPTDHDLRQRVDQLYQMIHELKVGTLTFGSVTIDDMDLNPKAPYDNIPYRAQLKCRAEEQVKNLHNQIARHPNYAKELRKKLHQVEEEMVFLNSRDKFLNVVLSFEKVMDECEAELQSHGDNSWWLCSPDISIADISFSILLHRLWLLGYERQMWERRPFVKQYYARVQQLESFKQATNIKGGNGMGQVVANPYFWGCVGALAIAGGGLYLWNKNNGSTWLQQQNLFAYRNAETLSSAADSVSTLGSSQFQYNLNQDYK